mgnify:CR=1 FL=1
MESRKVEEPSKNDDARTSAPGASTQEEEPPGTAQAHVDPHVRKAVFWATTLSRGLRAVNDSTLPAILMEFYTQEVELVVYQLLRVGESVATLRAHGFTSDEILEATAYTMKKAVVAVKESSCTAGTTVPTSVKVARLLFHDGVAALAMVRYGDWRRVGCSMIHAVVSEPTWLQTFLEVHRSTARNRRESQDLLEQGLRTLTPHVPLRHLRDYLKPLLRVYRDPKSARQFAQAGYTARELQIAGAKPAFVRAFQRAQAAPRSEDN